MAKAGTWVAICPDCDGHRDLLAWPPQGYWPVCIECSQPMNIYRRTPNIGRTPQQGVGSGQ